MAKKSIAQLKADLAAAKAQAAAATKKYQNTKSYDPNFAEIKADNDGAINDLNKAQAALDAVKTPDQKTSSATKRPSITSDNEPALSKISVQLDQARKDFGAADLMMRSHSTSSPEFIQAQADKSAAQTKISDLNSQIVSIQRTQDAKDAAAKVTETQAKIDRAKALGDDTTSLQNDLDKASAAQAEAESKAKTGTPELRYGPSGESLVPGSAAYNASTNKTPNIKTTFDTTAGAKGSQGAKGSKGKINTPPSADQAHALAEQWLLGKAGSGNMGGYAIQMGLVNSDPSLKEVFYNDVYLPIMNGKQPVDIAKFKSDVLNSKWYSSYIGPARTAEAAKYNDPATWQASVASATGIIQRQALSLGYDLSIDQLSSLADQALHKTGGSAEAIAGLPLEEIKLQIASVGKFNSAGGLAAAGVADLKSNVASYGIAHLYTQDQLNSIQDKIEKGTLDKNTVMNEFKSKAISAYQSLAPQINAGLTVEDVISPYKTLYGTTLELDPKTADVSDPNFTGKIFMQDPTDPTKQILKPLWQYQADLKKDPRWAYTDNARADLSSVGLKVAQNLGLAY